MSRRLPLLLSLGLIVTFLAASLPLGRAQTAQFVWTRGLGSTQDDIGLALAVTPDGDSLLAGHFDATLRADLLALPSGGTQNVFVARLSPTGSVRWLRSLSGTQPGEAQGVAIHRNGDIAVTGEFSGTVRFGATTRTATGLSDMFVATYDSLGRERWFWQGGNVDPAGSDTGMRIAADPNGGWLMVGETSGNVQFDTGGFSNLPLSTTVVVRLSAAGSETAVHLLPAGTPGQRRAITCDPSGNWYLAGGFRGSAELQGQPLVSQGLGNILVAKFSPSDRLLWVRTAGGTDPRAADNANGIVVGPSGVSYIAGQFNGRAMFGSIEVHSKGRSDLFLARLSQDGQPEWVATGGGTDSDAALDVAVDPEGNPICTGFIVGDAQVGNVLLKNGAHADLVVVKYSAQGNLFWARQAAGSAYSLGHGIGTDSSGNIYIGGYFRGSTTFGGLPQATQSQSLRDAMVVRLSEPPPPRLQGNVVGDRFSVSWPVTYPQFELEVSDASAAGPWRPAARQAGKTGGRFVVEEERSSHQRFHRLIRR